MRITEDFHDLLFLLEQERVRYLIIGGYAFSLHAVPRYTKDIDIWVEPSPANIEKANRALAIFGSPALLDASETTTILQIGIEPNRVDILLTITGLNFDDAWTEHVRSAYGDIDVNWIGINALIKAKTATGRRQDIADVDMLKKIQRGSHRS